MTTMETRDDLAERLRRIEGRLNRERQARLEAEHLLEAKSLALYEANLELGAFATDLENRVEERTRELEEARRLALQQAETDALTGIANRAAFTRRLDEMLADPEKRSAGIALLLIDLDDFKIVNDQLGHLAGDSLLVEVARRLVGAVRPDDVVARLGGDEFAVIACGMGSRQRRMKLARRLLETLSRPVSFNGRGIPSGCSIGIAATEPSGAIPESLLGDADLALYESKRAGRSKVTLFETRMRVAMERRSALEKAVRHAVVAGQIQPWYQPIRRCDIGCFTSAELLARWQLPSGQIRLPSVFMSTVEELGLLDTMMEKILRRALPEVRPLVDAGLLDYLSINVSPVQFNQGWAQQALPSLLDQTGFPAQALMVELTENALVYNIERTHTMLKELIAAGMRIAVDDFGVGYSNFSLLCQLPFHLLKLDRSLSCDIETDVSSRAVTECILALASRLKINVVAEGVETQLQSDFLLNAGCVAQQGFLFARPNRILQISDRPEKHLNT